jgi:acetyl-CoA carboxylase carboxyltransferase component
MGAEAASDIIFSRDIKAAEDPAAMREQKIGEYRELLYNPYVAARMGYINAVVQPGETRAKIIAALEALQNKKETRPAKKHGNIPM